MLSLIESWQDLRGNQDVIWDADIIPLRGR